MYTSMSLRAAAKSTAVCDNYYHTTLHYFTTSRTGDSQHYHRQAATTDGDVSGLLERQYFARFDDGLLSAVIQPGPATICCHCDGKRRTSPNENTFTSAMATHHEWSARYLEFYLGTRADQQSKYPRLVVANAARKSHTCNISGYQQA
jgi:hypothetical protein